MDPDLKFGVTDPDPNPDPNYYIVAEQIDECINVKIPQTVWAESAYLFVPVF
jgi:hypothetical protein